MSRMKIAVLLAVAALLSVATGAMASSAPRVRASEPNPYGATCNWIGQVMLVGFNYAPIGTEPAHGQILSITASRHNELLYSVLGNQFGGDANKGTFGLPDLRGKAPDGLHYVICATTGRYPGLAGGSIPCNFAGQIALVAFRAQLVSNDTVPADGQLLDQSSYALLFYRYGHTFGGTESSGKFGVPDLKGKAPPNLHYVVCTQNPSNYQYYAGDCNWVGQIILAGFMPREERGTVPARGQTLKINDWAALYTLFGTRFGSDGNNTFGVPNLKGKMPAGVHYLVCRLGPYPARS
jgi:microcystin-dependent protein